MPDREKVIKGLECHTEGNCVECPYRDGWRTCPFGETLLVDALTLLKKQEEETTFVYDEYTLPMCKKCGFHPFAGYIPTIKWMKERGYMRCPKCGRSVKWE